MMISVRVDGELDRLLRRAAEVSGRSRSDLVKASIREYCGRTLREKAAAPYELLKDFIGCAESGRGDLSTNVRKYVLEHLHAKRARNSR